MISKQNFVTFTGKMNLSKSQLLRLAHEKELEAVPEKPQVKSNQGQRRIRFIFRRNITEY